MAGFTIKNADTDDIVWKPGELGQSDVDKVAKIGEILSGLLSGFTLTVGIDDLSKFNVYDKDQVNALLTEFAKREDVSQITTATLEGFIAGIQATLASLQQADYGMRLDIEQHRGQIQALTERIGDVNALGDAGRVLVGAINYYSEYIYSSVDKIIGLKNDIAAIKERLDALEGG